VAQAGDQQALCYVFRPGEGGRQVLLGRKKRGFGAGMIMGPGGKTGPGEADAACAVREVREEAGITVDPDSLA
jgi:8-oxo-dGTP diphosphatase